MMAAASVLVLLLTSTLAAAAPTRPIPCLGERYLVEAPPPVGGGLTALTIGGSEVALQGACRRLHAKVRVARGGPRIEGRLARCPGLRGRIRLRVPLGPDCNALAGTLRTRTGPLGFAASRSHCGDGRVDPVLDEQCEGQRGCFVDQRCTPRCSCEQGPSSFTTTTATTSTIGTIASTTSTTGTTLAQPVCGNGVREGNEACDGDDFGGATCAQGGSLRCDPSCVFYSQNGCFLCGNGVKEGAEECDGHDFGGSNACDAPGEHGGELFCTVDCHVGRESCWVCGNGVQDPGEECDDHNLVDHDGCSHLCQRECGDGVVQRGEGCDDGNTVDGDGCSAHCGRERIFDGGGGEMWDECPANWTVEGYVGPTDTFTCEDGSVPCDRDSTSGTCRFLVFFCLNNPSRHLLPPLCFSTDTARLELTASTTLDATERAAIVDAFADAIARFAPASTFVRTGDAIEVTPPFVRPSSCGALMVPVPAGETGVLAVAASDDAMPPRVDVDTLTFACTSP
jgi:cysteine-rich repeat protein